LRVFIIQQKQRLKYLNRLEVETLFPLIVNSGWLMETGSDFSSF